MEGGGGSNFLYHADHKALTCKHIHVGELLFKLFLNFLWWVYVNNEYYKILNICCKYCIYGMYIYKLMLSFPCAKSKKKCMELKTEEN